MFTGGPRKSSVNSSYIRGGHTVRFPQTSLKHPTFPNKNSPQTDHQPFPGETPKLDQKHPANPPNSPEKYQKHPKNHKTSKSHPKFSTSPRPCSNASAHSSSCWAVVTGSGSCTQTVEPGSSEVLSASKIGSSNPQFYLIGAFYVGNGWDWGLLACLLHLITSDDWDHSRKFPAFGTSKLSGEISHLSGWNLPVSWWKISVASRPSRKIHGELPSGELATWESS